MDSLCHPWVTTTNLSYRFPIFETSATALCGTTGIVTYSSQLSGSIDPLKLNSRQYGTICIEFAGPQPKENLGQNDGNHGKTGRFIVSPWNQPTQWVPGRRCWDPQTLPWWSSQSTRHGCRCLRYRAPAPSPCEVIKWWSFAAVCDVTDLTDIWYTYFLSFDMADSMCWAMGMNLD